MFKLDRSDVAGHTKAAVVLDEAAVVLVELLSFWSKLLSFLPVSFCLVGLGTQ